MLRRGAAGNAAAQCGPQTCWGAVWAPAARAGGSPRQPCGGGAPTWLLRVFGLRPEPPEVTCSTGLHALAAGLDWRRDRMCCSEAQGGRHGCRCLQLLAGGNWARGEHQQPPCPPPGLPPPPFRGAARRAPCMHARAAGTPRLVRGWLQSLDPTCLASFETTTCTSSAQTQGMKQTTEHRNQSSPSAPGRASRSSRNPGGRRSCAACAPNGA